MNFACVVELLGWQPGGWFKTPPRPQLRNPFPCVNMSWRLFSGEIVTGGDAATAQASAQPNNIIWDTTLVIVASTLPVNFNVHSTSTVLVGLPSSFLAHTGIYLGK